MYVCFERRTRIPKMWALFSSLFCKEESVRKVCLDFGLSFDATTTGQGVTNDLPNMCFTLLHQLRKNQSTIISTKSAPVITPDTKDHNSLFFGYRHLNRLKFLHGTKLGEIRREKVVIFFANFNQKSSLISLAMYFTAYVEKLKFVLHFSSFFPVNLER